MKLGYLLVAIAVIFAALLIAYLYATDSPYRISAPDAKKRIQDGKVDLILDVRTPVERATLGFYPGSVPIPSSDLEIKMPSLFPDKTHVFWPTATPVTEPAWLRINYRHLVTRMLSLFRLPMEAFYRPLKVDDVVAPSLLNANLYDNGFLQCTITFFVLQFRGM